MRAALVAGLLVYAVAVAFAGTRWLPRMSWPLRAPRAGIAVWQAGSVSVAVSAAAAGLILAIPCVRLSTGPAVLPACLTLTKGQYATPQGAAAGTAGALLTLGIAGRIAWCASLAMAAARRRRAAHDDALAVVARPWPASDVKIIDDDRSTVYCLPGRGQIVLTTGALRCLDPLQLDAVLAHERTHLSGRHHLVLTLASALKDAFPPVRFFTLAARQVGDLVEVAADDAATRRTHRLTLAGPCSPWPPRGFPQALLAREDRLQRGVSGVLSTRPARPARSAGPLPQPLWSWRRSLR